MPLPDLIEQARQGDASAIARLISRSLVDWGVVAQAHWQGPDLHIHLEADQPLDGVQTMAIIRRGFRRLGMVCPVAAVEVVSRQVGRVAPSWRDRFSLTPGPSLSPPAAPLPPMNCQPDLDPMAMGQDTPPAPYLTDATLVALTHLAPLVGYLMVGVSGFTGFPVALGGSFLLPWRLVAPLVLLLTKGSDSPYLQQQAKEALNFQVMMLILWVITIALMVILIGFLLALPLALFEIVMVVIATGQTAEGKAFRYPLTWQWVR